MRLYRSLHGAARCSQSEILPALRLVRLMPCALPPGLDAATALHCACAAYGIFLPVQMLLIANANYCIDMLYLKVYIVSTGRNCSSRNSIRKLTLQVEYVLGSSPDIRVFDLAGNPYLLAPRDDFEADNKLRQVHKSKNDTVLVLTSHLKALRAINICEFTGNCREVFESTRGS